ncbi:hypothetical protein [Candidatus Frankia nodulisporulans]|uniref:hypothetical protein n=2 Tax=Candidatus Frankia nodulisporulans TaxID=2060052 RepID=UPI0013D134C2|nr:hypothetical protein [Candidatus Frankia nodulisporulans]
MAPAAREDRRYEDFGGYAGHGANTAAHTYPHHQSAPRSRDGRHSQAADGPSDHDRFDDRYGHDQLPDSYPEEYPPAYPAEPRPRGEPARSGAPRPSWGGADGDARPGQEPRPGRDQRSAPDRWDGSAGAHRDDYDRPHHPDRADRAPANGAGATRGRARPGGDWSPAADAASYPGTHRPTDRRPAERHRGYADDHRYDDTGQYGQYLEDGHLDDRYPDASRHDDDYSDDHDAPTGPQPSWQPGGSAHPSGAAPYRPRAPLTATGGAPATGSRGATGSRSTGSRSTGGRGTAGSRGGVGGHDTLGGHGAHGTPGARAGAAGPVADDRESLLPYVMIVLVVALVAGTAGYVLNRLVGPSHRQHSGAPADPGVLPADTPTSVVSAPATGVGTPTSATGGAAAGEAASGLTAEQVALRLRTAGLPLRTTAIYTAATDPDHLLGTTGGYTSRVAFRDPRVGSNEVQGAPAGAIERGGAIEVFSDAAAAERRARTLLTVTAEHDLVTEHVYRRADIVLRVSLALTDTQAKGYETTLARLPVG